MASEGSGKRLGSDSGDDPLARPSGDAPDALVYSAWGGSYDECIKRTYFKDFTEATGVEVKFGSFGYDSGNWEAQQLSGNVEWDVAMAPTASAASFIEQDYLLPLDTSFLEAYGGLIDFPYLTSSSFADADYYVANELVANVIVWNPARLEGDGPQTWADLFDTDKFPGKRMFPKEPTQYGLLEAALLADGVARDELYPLDIDRALEKLDTIKDDIVWWESGDQQVQYLNRGEAVMGLAWDGRVKFAQSEGSPVDFTYDDAIVRSSSLWSVPKGAPNPEWAAYLIRFVMEPKEQAKLIECIGYSPSMVKTYDELPSGSAFTEGFVVPRDNPNDASDAIKWDLEYWNENAKSVTETFNEWLIG